MEEKRVQELPIGSHLAEDTKGPLIAGVSETYSRDLADEALLITFDSSPRLDDAAAVVFSKCTSKFEIQEYLGSFSLFGRPLSGAEWVDVVVTAQERYQLKRP
jgi:hypothetical protein